MSLESKRVVVNPDEETLAIDTERAFGWSLKSRNEVLNSREVFDGAYSYSYNGISSGVVNTHTECDHFVSLLFERDKNGPFYEQFVAIEKEHEAARDHYRSAQDEVSHKMPALMAKRKALQDKKTGYHGWKSLMAFGIFFVFLFFLVSIIVTATAGYSLIWAAMSESFLTGALFIGFAIYYKGKDEHPTELNAAIAKAENDIETLKNDSLAGPLAAIQSALEKGNALVDQVAKSEKKESGSSPDPISALESLKRLHEQGVLTDEEYQKKKETLLAKI